GGVIKDDFKILLSHIKDNYMPNINAVKNNIKDGVKNKTKISKEKVDEVKSNVIDFTSAKIKKNKTKVKILGTDIEADVEDDSVKIPLKTFKSFARFTGVKATIRPKVDNTEKVKEDKSPVKDIKIKNSKVKDKDNSRFNTDDKYDVKDKSQKSKGIRSDVA
ncbi:hypothetical protein V6O07_11660, partial [Arthrospira platensis SPKY2]